MSKQSALIAVFLGLVIVISGCVHTGDKISGTRDLVLDEQDLQQLGMTGHGCQTDEEYSNIVDSSLGQYSFCNYTINSLDDTEVVIELQKFANYEALDGTYQYDSSHLFGVKGLISENDYGDQSRFRVNSEDDYMGHLNEPGVYYYHLWICKDLYLIHITSSGGSEDAEGYVANIGRQILSKFG